MGVIYVHVGHMPFPNLVTCDIYGHAVSYVYFGGQYGYIGVPAIYHLTPMEGSIPTPLLSPFTRVQCVLSENEVWEVDPHAASHLFSEHSLTEEVAEHACPQDIFDPSYIRGIWACLPMSLPSPITGRGCIDMCAHTT